MFQIWWKTFIYTSKNVNKVQAKNQRDLYWDTLLEDKETWKQQDRNDIKYRGSPRWDSHQTSHLKLWRQEGSEIIYSKCYSKRKRLLTMNFLSSKTILQKWRNSQINKKWKHSLLEDLSYKNAKRSPSG